METTNNDHLLILERIRRWGGASSDALLDPACKIFTLPSIDGLIGYKIESSRAIVFGDPLCKETDIPKLTFAFISHCKNNGLSWVFITCSEQFSVWALSNICNGAIEYGKEITIDPHHDPRQRTGVNASLVRRKVRHAEKEHVSIHEYSSEDLAIESAIEEVGQSWLQARKGAQVHISHVRLFADRLGKRWFYAKQNEKIVCVILLNRLEEKKGWLINHLMTIPSAPHGVQELIVIKVLEYLAAEGCHYASFGFTPLNKLGKTQGFSRFYSFMLKVSYSLIKGIFRLSGHQKFWEKFGFQSNPSYLLFPSDSIHFRDLYALSKALNVTIYL